ncbi:hypothetical protein XYCOK13_24340 [Xylanibacillus composti]|uniref:Peptidase S9 prolyl oligopeptidase catalytic domain-containing protein n=2 Tax=Xylanibacillus composti TaxID=1572762 RepID=A0A8J4H4R1_9BACL|nr:hypothetical protein XYCOK13_24340 [Xylanibacillus composti]
MFFHGTADQNVPYEHVSCFVNRLQSNGNDCTLLTFPGMGHGFFRYGENGNVPYARTIEASVAFLQRIQLIA